MTLTREYLYAPGYIEDPYSHHEELRKKGPIHRIDFPPGIEAYLVVDHQHGRAVLNDPRMAKNTVHSAVPISPEGFFVDTLLGIDPPDHTRLRNLVAKAFTARRVENLRPRVQEITDELLDAIDGKAEVDLMSEFAVPLPLRVMAELLGLDPADHENLRTWTAAVTVPAVAPKGPDHRRTVGAFFQYLTDVVADRRENPKDDLITALVQARDGRSELSEIELRNTIALMFVAGHDTTVSLISKGVLALLTNPDQLALLRSRPELMPSAVEEFLRYDGPLERASQRIALEELEIAGTRVPKGAWVHVSLGAAGRDPAAFPDPDALDVTREPNRHLAFGHGIHFCLGAPLGRMEGQIAIGTLLRRFPDLALAVPPEKLYHHHTGSVVRELVELPVKLQVPAGRSS